MAVKTSKVLERRFMGDKASEVLERVCMGGIYFMSDDKQDAILQLVSNIDRRLTDHMEREEGKIEQIFDSISQQREELNRRIDTFMQNMSVYMDKQECIEKAFLKHPDGGIDCEGHREDHLTRKEFGDWASQVKKDVVGTAVKGGVLGFLTWAGYYIWIAFLQGPKQ